MKNIKRVMIDIKMREWGWMEITDLLNKLGVQWEASNMIDLRNAQHEKIKYLVEYYENKNP